MGEEYNAIISQQLQNLDTEVLNLVSGIICTSEHTRQFLQDQGISVRTVIAPPGVFSLSPEVRSKNRANIILVVGSLTHQKNQLWLLKHLLKFELRLTVLIVGAQPDPRYVEELETLSQGIHIFKIIGEVSSLDSYYEQADVLVHTPTNESYGMVLTEAMGHGLPIIATNVGGISQTLRDAGILIESGASEQLFESLNLLLTTPEVYQMLSKRSISRFRQLITWEETADKIWRFISTNS